MESLPKKALWRDEGVYLVAGGLGGIGIWLCRSIAAQTANATLIVCGKGPLDPARQAKIDELTALGLAVDFQQCDIAERHSVQAMAAYIESTHRRLDGVIHCAGIIKDSYLLKKSAPDVEQVLCAKIKGLVNLDAATAGFALDHFICFSSIVAVSGNVGQADYAVANGFMDHYVEYRNELVSRGERSGKSLAIDWPHWSEGGMRIDAASKFVLREIGIGELDTREGLDILQRCVGLDGSHYLVFAGDLTRRDRHLSGRAPDKHDDVIAVEAESTEKVAHVRSVTGSRVTERNQLKTATGKQLTALFARIAKLPVERIDEQESLTAYGIDSLMITELNYQLGLTFDSLSKTLFYEYGTLADVAAYLVEEDAEACLRWTGGSVNEVTTSVVTETRTVEVVSNEVATSVVTETKTVEVDANEVATSVATETKTVEVVTNEVATSVVVETSTVEVAAAAPKASASTADHPIAIIGLAGRYPQAKDLREFWQNLQAGKDSVVEIPSNRWALDDFFLSDVDEAIRQGLSYSKWGGFLEDYDSFDSAFFGISPREAQNVDPQERLFLECCWHVFEDAGYTRESLQRDHQGRVGVFVGITKTGFDLNSQAQWLQGEAAYGRTSFASVANRVSYFFNLCGPSMPVDTMCSASLTAIHLACEHLRRDECELAVAGGVNLYLHPSNYIGMCSQRMLSADGRCKSFGDKGNGFVPGEGVGAVLLKPLAQAQAAGDNIHGVIRASSINHGGRTHGYTVPNPNAQAELIGKALQRAAIDPRQISYIEAHGTGTALGDPIEITGLTKAFSEVNYRKERAIDVEPGRSQYCAIGSVKSNIGHLEAAAGIAGLTKILLQMRHRTLVPSLHTEGLNPNIDFAKTPFVVQRDLAAWQRPCLTIDGERGQRALIAGISSFGAGGANAHVLVEEYEGSQRHADAADEYLVPLSANSEPQLLQMASELVAFLDCDDEQHHAIADIAYTLQVGREALSERMAVIAKDRSDLKAQLAAYLVHRKVGGTLFRGSVGSRKRQAAEQPSSQQLPSGQSHSEVLGQWVQGEKVDWRALYGNSPGRRVSLPLYPFERRYFPVKYDQERPSIKHPQVEVSTHVDIKPTRPAGGKIHLAPLGTGAISGDKHQQAISPNAIEAARSSASQRKLSLATSPEESVAADKPNVSSEARSGRSRVATKALQQQAHRSSADEKALHRELAGSLEKILMMEGGTLDDERNFTDLGLDSVLGVEWVQFINRKYQCNFPTTVLYDYPTLRDFASFAASQLLAAPSSAEPIGMLPEKILELLYSGAIELETAKNQLAEMNYLQETP
jgi:3-oxoacyl-(acyl-carrier-protein) synthase/acyl carrier protein